ncbi:MAG: twin-arginine translocase subunit TatC [Bacteroidetes bacterium]|nr:MAG: twin-arginine translocase subunit TatC [Bacteroidota bacterium]RLD72792.1 MAG: twin-arginine translocase subunit TatC [Bacteroidota bacterium]RLD95218.1 MAG: twin-arginine translocase subunit TatC [Bacteroidota bacterium]
MSKTTEGEMSFLEHLEVMRWHLLRSIAAIVILALVAFVFKEIVFDKIILAPKEPPFPTNRWLCQLGEILGMERICINQNPFTLQTVKMAEQFSMHIIVSLVAGIVIAFPYIFWEFWRFIIPALYDKEKNTAQGAVFFTSLLFILGVLFGYYIISPLSVNFLGNYKVSESVISAPTLRSYVQTITSVVLAAGLVFQLPILVYFLSKVGLVTPDFLKKYRRHSLVLIVTLSAIITPPDVFSQVLVALPLMVLYEIGIAISKRIMRQQAAEEVAREEAYKSKKKRPAKDPEAGKAEPDKEPETEKKEPADESSTKEEVSSKKPWKRPASKSDPDEEEETGEEDSDPGEDKTD